MGHERIKKLIDCLNHSNDSGCDCESAYIEFECLAEQAAQGYDIHEIQPQVADHLDRCTDCREEFDALVAIIRADRPDPNEQ